jgi:hypothetical protein
MHQRLLRLPGVAVLIAFLILGVRGGNDKAPGTDEECGTCDTLGYICLHPNASVHDRCDRVIEPSSCPIPKCAEYCRATVPNATGGDCSRSLHLCECTVPPPPPPALPTGASDCVAQSCPAIKTSGWQCIPNGTIDGCTRQRLNESSCAPLIPSCDTTCHSRPGTSSCLANVNRCRCGPAVPNVTTTTAGRATPSPAAVRARGRQPGTTATATVVRGGNVRLMTATPDLTVLNGDATIDTSLATLWAMITVAILGGALVLGAVIYIIYVRVGTDDRKHREEVRGATFGTLASELRVFRA